MTDMAEGHAEDENRREFLYLAAGAVGAVGAASFAWPLIDQMNPPADVLALSTTEVDISGIPVGASITIKWRGQAVFVRHRTAEEIKEAEDVKLSELRDPEPDKDRVEKPEWLIVLGSCTRTPPTVARTIAAGAGAIDGETARAMRCARRRTIASVSRSAGRVQSPESASRARATSSSGVSASAGKDAAPRL